VTTAREHQTGLGPARRPAQAPELAVDPAGWIARFKRLLSDRVFASADAFARQHGWEITKTTTWSGFGARSYRDPRFGPRCNSPSELGIHREGVR
jgi:hypothetical protein